MRTLTPDCFSPYCSSRSRYAGLTLTRMAPAFAAAYCVIAHSALLRTPDADTVAALHPERDQCVRRAIDLVAKFRVAVAQVLMEGNQRIARAEPARGCVQGLAERLAQEWTRGNAVGIRQVHRVARSLTCDRRRKRSTSPFSCESFAQSWPGSLLITLTLA